MINAVLEFLPHRAKRPNQLNNVDLCAGVLADDR